MELFLSWLQERTDRRAVRSRPNERFARRQSGRQSVVPAERGPGCLPADRVSRCPAPGFPSARFPHCGCAANRCGTGSHARPSAAAARSGIGRVCDRSRSSRAGGSLPGSAAAGAVCGNSLVDGNSGRIVSTFWGTINDRSYFSGLQAPSLRKRWTAVGGGSLGDRLSRRGSSDGWRYRIRARGRVVVAGARNAAGRRGLPFFRRGVLAGRRTARDGRFRAGRGRYGSSARCRSEWQRGTARRKVYIHVNNTNPMLDERSTAYRSLREIGIEVGYDGMEMEV